jgi:16S rRNA (cytidine1402-2'-O)-methyltransferase
MVLALAASGLQGQSFAFVGYLPQDAQARRARLRELQQRSRREGQTQLLIETPYRNATVMAALLEDLDPDTRVSVACGLSLPQGWCRTATVAQWRKAPPTFDKGVPAVFGFLGY